MMFIGLRAGYSTVTRSPTYFQVVDSLWGTDTSSDKARNFNVFWAELTGGVRVEIAKGLDIGWTVRGKFVMNGHSFKNYAPLYIAGYGKGDKTAVFDFNMYLSYSIRWRRKHNFSLTK